MINVFVLAWFLVGVLGVLLRCLFFRQSVSLPLQCLVLLYCGAPFLVPFTPKAVGILVVFLPYFLHRYFSHIPLLNGGSLFGLWLVFECGWMRLPFESTLPVSYAIILLTFFSIFILFSESRPINLFIDSFKMGKKDIQLAVYVYIVLLISIIPLGYVTGFLSFQFFNPNLTFFVQTIVIGYFLYALPEELLFRFLMIDFLRPFLKSERFLWIVTSCIFGLAHINNQMDGTVGFNWPYVLLGTIAGLGYGFVFMKTKKVSASALTHALINMTWGMFFNTPY